MIYADLHVHSFLSPYEQRENNDDPNSRDPNDESSVWHQFPEEHNLLLSLGEKFGFTTYSESDFAQSALSGAHLLNISLYPPERGFFELDEKTLVEKIIQWFGLQKPVEVELGHLISGFSKNNVRYIKSSDYDYFKDLNVQLAFIKNTKPYSPDPDKCVGTVYGGIKGAEYIILQTGKAHATHLTGYIIQIILSVEGGSAFWSNFAIGDKFWNGSNFEEHLQSQTIEEFTILSVPDFRNVVTRDLIVNHRDQLNELIPWEVCDALMTNVRTFLAGTKIFSYTLAHHFYNGLCGHCASLQPLTDHKLVNQSFGIQSDITNLGYLVVNELLKNHVIIDVKHMSWRARQSYYCYRRNNYPNIPIIASHAAVNGFKWIGDQLHSFSPDNPFYQVELNLYDEDIYEIVRSKGLIGIVMDQRVNGVKNSSLETLWLQFQYIAERAAEGTRILPQTVWDNVCLGTDFDGVIHPVDEFQTYTDFNKANNSLSDFLINHISEYMKNPPHTFLDRDRLEPQEILSKICYTNLSNFIENYYI